MNQIPMQYNQYSFYDPYYVPFSNPYASSYPLQNSYINPYNFSNPYTQSDCSAAALPPADNNITSEHELSHYEKPSESVPPKRKALNISLTADEKETLKQRAKAAHMSVSDYVRKQCIYNTKEATAEPDILQHVAEMSNCVNQIDNEYLKKALSKGVMAIWRYLS